MPVLIYAGLFIAVILSGLAFYILPKNNKLFLKLLLSFSGSYLFALCLLHLIPEIYSGPKGHSIGFYILVGFFIQLLLEFFSHGLEHGHAHHTHKAIPVTMIFSLCIHAFLEAMPLAYGLDHNHSPHVHHSSFVNSMLFGIILHNIPITIVLVGMLHEAGISRGRLFFILVLFASMAPLGALFSYLIGNNFIENLSQYFDKILAIVVGIFLHISTTILFETTENHRFNLYKFLSILAGAGIAWVTL